MADDTDSTAQRVWVVDDDRAVRFVLCTALRDAGYRVEGFDGAASALAMLDTQPPPDLLFTDVRMPGDDGLVLLDKLKAAHPQLPVIVMSAYTDVASTAGAFRGGAQEFLSKPFDLDDAVALAQRVLPAPDALADAPAPAAVEPLPDRRPQLVGDTPAMRALFRAIGRLAQAPLSVLINGETGTGKELVAHALHHESPRVQGPFVALNTAAIPSELLESELFGHEAGAFTGAQRRHVGRFEQANGGTLFLDEIGDMPLPLQTRLLRVLAEGEFFRVGGRELIRVDVRVIAATHQDLESLVAQGRFRADLLHRLDVVRLRLPPLRERRDDITQLADTFLAAAVRKLDAPPKRLTAAALQALREHDWPATYASWKMCAGAWQPWPPRTPSGWPMWTARCIAAVVRAPARRAIRASGKPCCRPGRANAWPKAQRACTRRCATGWTRHCWKRPCRSPTGAGPKRPRAWAWAATP